MQQMAKLLTYILIKIVLWNLPAPARRSFLLCKIWVLYDVTSWSSLVLAKMQRKDWPQWPEGEAIRWFSGVEGGTGHQGADRSVVSRSCCVINMTRSDTGQSLPSAQLSPLTPGAQLISPRSYFAGWAWWPHWPHHPHQIRKMLPGTEETQNWE